MFKKIVVGMLASVYLWVSSIAFADNIYLTSGRKIQGTVVSETDTKIIVRVNAGTITLQRSQILNIEHSQSEEIQDSRSPTAQNLESPPQNTSSENLSEAKTIETEDHILYIPSSADPQTSYPLAIVLSPSGDASQSLQTWKAVADKFKWVVLCSKKFRNGLEGNEQSKIFSDITASIQQRKLPVSIDQRRILSGGLSGGGMGSHFFSFFHQDLIDVVLSNTGMMHSEFSNTNKNQYPRNKKAVFLASPTDFRYEEMKRDKIFLETLGWETKWIEFEGGHVIAPQEIYLEAAQWISEQWL